MSAGAAGAAAGAQWRQGVARAALPAAQHPLDVARTLRVAGGAAAGPGSGPGPQLQRLPCAGARVRCHCFANSWVMSGRWAT